MEGQEGTVCLTTTHANEEGLGYDGFCHSPNTAELDNTKSVPAQNPAPRSPISITFRYVADRVLLVIAYLSSVVAAVQTRSSKPNTDPPQQGCGNIVHPSSMAGPSAADPHSKAVTFADCEDEHPSGMLHRAKRSRKTAAPPAAEYAQALAKPARIRALEKIASSVEPGWKHQHKKRRLKHSVAKPAAVQEEEGVVSDDSNGVEDSKQGDLPFSQDFVAQGAHGSKVGEVQQGSGEPKQDVPADHRVDRMFIQPEFLKIEQQVGKQFTVDCFCREDGSNSHCGQYFSPADSFFQQNLVDQHCWINPPFNMIRETLEHYQSCKQKQPDRISAVFCLPAPRAHQPPEWLHLVKGMQVLKQYKRGTRLFTGPNPSDETQRHLLPGIRQEIIIYYDPVRAADTEPQIRADMAVQSSGTVRLKTTHVMQIPITVSGVACSGILDTGAEHTSLAPDGIFLSAQTATRNGLQVIPLQETVTLAGVGGQDCVVHGKARLTIRIGRLTEQVTALVMDMDEKLDIILGETWLDKHKAVLDYGSRACMFVKRGRKFIVRCAKPRQPRREAHAKPNILTVTQTKRIMRKKSVWYCLALVQEVQEANKAAEISDPRVKSLVEKFPTVFTEAPPKGGSAIQAEHECIPLPEGTKPTFRPMFRYSPAEMELMESRIAELLENGYIEPSTSPYGAPVLFVKKPRSTELRLVIDYRMLNKLTLRNRHPLPRIDDMLDALAGAKYFTAIDLRQAYHQIKLKESDRPKTAFRTPFGHYQWVTLSMGLTNAPAVFQSVVNNIFRPYLNKFVVVYLDDICVFSKTQEEHMRHLELVLEKLKQYNLTAAWHKCHFYQEELLFLGHIVSENGVKADPAKVKAVAEYPTPQDQHQVRSFLGMCNYFRRFINKYAPMVSPLTQLTRKDSIFKWGTQQEEAFTAVKTALTTAPVLILPDWRSDKPFEITCDASYQGISGVLTQEGRPIAYESRKLNTAESRYPATEIEMLAVVHCLKTWRCYIEGREVHVYTDHKPNTTYVTNPMLTRRQARWLEELQAYNLQFHYKAGAENVVADALSRHPVGEAAAEVDISPSPLDPSKERKLIGMIPACVLTARAKQLSRTVPFLEQVREGYKQDKWFADPANTVAFTQVAGVYTLHDAIVLPDYAALRKQVLRECHDTPYSGHPGRDKTLNLVKRLFWWPSMATDVADYVKRCLSCQRNKSRNQLPGGLLQPLPIPGEPWESVSMDFVVDLPITPAGYDSITVIVDRLTKMVILTPCKKTDTAEDVAHLFMKEVCCRKGLPQSIVTDRDPKFTGNFFRELMSLWGTQQNMSTSFHPQTDGNTERVNRVMEDMIRHFIAPDQTNWDRLLPLIEFAINNSYHESIRTTPFMLNYGREPATPLKRLLAEDWRISKRDKVPRAHEFIQQMREAHTKAAQCLRAAQQRQKAYADQKRRDVDFAVGQKVWLSTKNITLKMVGTPKFLPKFIGPFPIAKKVNAVAYKLQLPPCLKRIHSVFHASLLAEYHENTEQQPAPLPTITDDGLEYEVEAILNHRYRVSGGKWNKTKTHKFGRKRTTEYLVKWKGYQVEDNTWEPEENCTNCQEKVQQYWQAVQQKEKLEIAEHMLKLQDKKLKRSRHRS